MKKKKKTDRKSKDDRVKKVAYSPINIISINGDDFPEVYLDLRGTGRYRLSSFKIIPADRIELDKLENGQEAQELSIRGDLVRVTVS